MQFSKAYAPTAERLLGKFTLLSDVQSAKARSPIRASLSGKDTFSSDTAFSKAKPPISVTVSGIVTFFRNSIDINALFPTRVTPLSIFTVFTYSVNVFHGVSKLLRLSGISPSPDIVSTARLRSKDQSRSPALPVYVRAPAASVKTALRTESAKINFKNFLIFTSVGQKKFLIL